MTEPYPLAKPKFWARSIVAIGEVMAELGRPVPEVCRRSIPSLTTEKVPFFAETMWRLGEQMRSAVYKINDRERPLDKWWQLRGYVLGEGLRSDIGKIVFIQDAVIGKRLQSGVGQLIGIDHEPTGNRKYHYDDQGPLSLLQRFNLRLFDGNVINWTNASYGVVPTVRTIDMFRDIMERHS